MPGPLGGCEAAREGVKTLDFWTLGRADPSESLAADGSFLPGSGLGATATGCAW